MAKHIWTVLCSKASVDQRSNNVSLFDVIEELQLHDAPSDTAVMVPVQLELVTLWTRSQNDGPEMGLGRAFLLAPSGEQFMGAEFEIALREHLRARNIMQMNGIPLHGPGVYYFVIELQSPDTNSWSEVSRVPVEVKYIAPVPN